MSDCPNVKVKERETAICPEHAGNAKRPAPVALDGEQPLW